MSNDETVCPACGQTVSLTTKGAPRAHDRSIARGDYTQAERCPGSGVAPE